MMDCQSCREYDPNDPTLNMTIEQLRDETDRFDKAWDLAESDEYGPEPEDSDQCYNCGAYAKACDGHTYVCPVCGDEWDIWLDPLEDY